VIATVLKRRVHTAPPGGSLTFGKKASSARRTTEYVICHITEVLQL